MDIWYVYVFILYLCCPVEALRRTGHSSNESYRL
jgi:hypothetical protein